MRCLFCKQDSSSSTSVEHIIPESLGNTTSILPKGVVCDKCNNYFARKVEQPFLESFDVRALRFREAIPNKRGFVPHMDGILDKGIHIKVHNPFPGIPLFANEKDAILEIESEHIDITKISRNSKIIIPAFTDEMIPQNTKIVSRFVAKIALESLALRLIDHEGGLDYLVNESAYDPIRDYVRFGNLGNWPCNIRRLYEMDKLWADGCGNQYQKVHESDFLLIPIDVNADLLNDDPVVSYSFFVLSVFGLEFVINIAGPDADGLDPYKIWLQEHGNVSPLYYGANANK